MFIPSFFPKKKKIPKMEQHKFHQISLKINYLTVQCSFLQKSDKLNILGICPKGVFRLSKLLH